MNSKTQAKAAKRSAKRSAKREAKQAEIAKGAFGLRVPYTDLDGNARLWYFNSHTGEYDDILCIVVSNMRKGW